MLGEIPQIIVEATAEHQKDGAAVILHWHLPVETADLSATRVVPRRPLRPYRDGGDFYILA